MRYTRRTLVGSAGIAATVLLHTILVAVAVWGEGRFLLNPKLPDAVGAGANVGEPEGEIGERRIVVMLTPAIPESTPSFEAKPLLPEPVIETPSIVEIAGPDALPMPPIIDLPGEESEAQDAQLMARAKYAGIYESQVRARIERAWRLPDGPAAEQEFTCLVLITQQRDGRVKEVELVTPKCQGSDDWQMSLVQAIQVSSPLPAPPHPSVFVDRFSLSFRSSAAPTPNRAAQR